MEFYKKCHLKIFGLVAGSLVMLSGCAYNLKPDSPRKVYGFEKKISAGGSYYQSALIDERLETNKLFRVSLNNLPLEPDGRVNLGDSIKQLDSSCYSGQGAFSVAGIKVKPGTEFKTVSVTAVVHSPFSMGISNWIDKCHCAEVTGETKNQCFDHRLLGSILEEVKSLTGETLSDASRREVVRAASWPLIGFDTLAQRDRFLIHPPGSTGYMGQKLEPGDELCLHTASHASAWMETPGISIDSSEPTALACFEWRTIMRGRYRAFPTSKALASVGVDTFGRIGPSWTQGEGGGSSGKLKGKPRQAAEGDLVTNVDMLNGSNQNPYRYAVVFSKNVWFSIAQTALWDSELKTNGTVNGIFNRGDKTSFLLLIRDRSLMEFTRDHITNGLLSDDNNALSKFGDMQTKLHTYFKNIVKKWANEEGKAITDTTEWMRDLQFPVNSRPFVRVPVRIDGRDTYVRAGTSLLNLIDRRLGLSTQVFELRGGGKTIHQDGAGGEHEEALVAAATAQVSYHRRFGVKHRKVDLENAKRLEDLMILLNSGDVLSWR